MVTPARQLVLAQHRLPRIAVITVGGELDALTADRLGAFVRRSRRPGDHVVLDLAGMTFMDSTGLHVLLDAHHEVRRDGATLRLAALRHSPARIIRLTGVSAYLPVHATLEQALSTAFAAARTRHRHAGDDGVAPV